MTQLAPAPFSSRHSGQHRQIDGDFPTSARTGLLHLVSDLIEREFVKNWIVVARELHRIGRLPLVSYEATLIESMKKAQIDTKNSIESIDWAKLYDFCERLYSHLANEAGWEDNYGNYTARITRSDAQAYIAKEIQLLFLEEGLAYEFSEGAVRRQGRKHTVGLVTKAQVVLGDHQLLGARRHYEKARHYFSHPSKPDYENSVKEAVCAVEATAKTLFPKAKASTLGDFIKWLANANDIEVPKSVAQTFSGVYGFRNGGDGVAHGGANGGKATLEVAEYILAVSASQIIYLVDLANGLESDVPF